MYYHQQEQDPGDMEPTRPRDEDDWYHAVVTRWITDEDMNEILANHTGSEADRRTFKASLEAGRLKGDDLDEFARIAFGAATNLASWLEKKQTEINRPQDTGAASREMQQGRNNALEYAGHIVARHAPRGHWHTQEWDNQQDAEEWAHEALLREQDTARTGDNRHFLQTMDEIHQECLDPEIPRTYAREREARQRAMDEYIAECLQEERRAWEQLEHQCTQQERVRTG